MRKTIRERLAAKLRELGFECEPEDLKTTTGGTRRWAIQNETYRWEADVKCHGVNHWLVSYSTMTECVKFGFTIDHDDEVFATC